MSPLDSNIVNSKNFSVVTTMMCLAIPGAESAVIKIMNAVKFGGFMIVTKLSDNHQLQKYIPST